MKTVSINGAEYTLASIKTGVGRKLKEKFPDNVDFNVALIAASFNAGGHPEITAEWIDENVDYFGAFSQLLTDALEVNGLKVKTGEAQPAGAATELTSDTSASS